MHPIWLTATRTGAEGGEPAIDMRLKCSLKLSAKDMKVASLSPDWIKLNRSCDRAIPALALRNRSGEIRDEHSRQNTGSIDGARRCFRALRQHPCLGPRRGGGEYHEFAGLSAGA